MQLSNSDFIYAMVSPAVYDNVIKLLLKISSLFFLLSYNACYPIALGKQSGLLVAHPFIILFCCCCFGFGFPYFNSKHYVCPCLKVLFNAFEFASLHAQSI